MIKAISLVILACGILFLFLGISASNEFSSDVSRFFTGSATDKAVWMLAGGVAGTVIGLVGLLRESKSN